MESLSQHFEKKIYQYINITWLVFTGKHLRWSLILILNIAKVLIAPILKKIFKRLLWNWQKINFIYKEF